MRLCRTFSRLAHSLPTGVVLVALLTESCARKILEPIPPAFSDPPTSGKLIVDDSPAWSPDGLFIAFHRAFSSSYGPAGVYITSRWGGTPRLLVAGDYFGPRYLDFSPDGRRLVASWGLQLVIIGVEDGSLLSPFYTHDGASFPDWSPNGSLIVYRRAFRDYNEPPDSGGFHFYDLSTGEDTPVRLGTQVIWGRRTRWSPDGSEIALIRGSISPIHDIVSVLRADGSQMRDLVESPQGIEYDYIQWYDRRLTGTRGVLFQRASGRPRETYFVAPDGTGLRTWLPRLGAWDAVSPDGSEIAMVGAQQSDSLPVLFIVKTDDPTGASRRQLTYWAPPATTAGQTLAADSTRAARQALAAGWKGIGRALPPCSPVSQHDALERRPSLGPGYDVVQWKPRSPSHCHRALHPAGSDQFSH